MVSCRMYRDTPVRIYIGFAFWLLQQPWDHSHTYSSAHPYCAYCYFYLPSFSAPPPKARMASQATALSRPSEDDVNTSTTTPSQDPALRLPRILCLHGGGTNARIFRAQCRVLERELRSRCRLCYADAPFPASQPGPDVTSVYGSYGPFRSWLEENSDNNSDRDADATGSKIHEALQRAIAADDGRGATGEWVGLLGFSQGAKICASLLFSQQMQMQMQMGLPANHTRANDATAGPAFRFAILMAGRGPLVALRSGAGAEALRALALGIAERGHLLRIPTIHVHGREDAGLELHRRMLHQYCDSRYKCVVEWDGEHRVPIKTKDVLLVAEAILAVIADTRPRGI
jgi:predicted esterase